MPITEELMDVGAWSVTLDPATPRSVLSAINVESALWSTLVVLPVWHRSRDLSDAEMLTVACYRGVYLSQPDDRCGLAGQGMAWWLGTDGDGGDIYATTDATDSGVTFAGHLTARVYSNSFTAGTVAATATTFAKKVEGGDTPREQLDTLCAMAPGGPNLWRIRYSSGFVIDADDEATLWPTKTTPSVVLADATGRDGTYSGFDTAITLGDVDGSEVRSTVIVDWNDGTSNGTSSPSLPATMVDPAGGSPEVEHYMDWRPKRNRPPTERWRKLTAWGINANARANSVASREANERTSPRQDVTADIDDIYCPWRYALTPGNTVYLHDPERALTGTTAIQFRGDTIYPATGRVDQMDTPILDGYGVYLRAYDGISAFSYVDLTDYVIPDGTTTTLRMNHRERIVEPKKAVRLTGRDKKRLRTYFHDQAQLAKYLSGSSR